MALHYVLDGYNIIKSGIISGLAHGSLEEQRERLVRLLADLRPQGSLRNRVTVVFDGPADVPAYGEYPARQYAGNIETVFSEGESADDRIARIVEGSTNRAGIVVVTNDKGIRRLLGGSGAKYMPVAEFARLSRRSRNVPGTGGALDEKAAGEINDELKDKWLKNE